VKQVRGFWRETACALLLLLLLVSEAGAQAGGAASGVLKGTARLREGPSTAGALITQLPPGTRVEIIGATDGWRQVRIEDGRVGFIWGEHLAASPPAAPSGREAGGPRALAEEIAALRADVSALRERQEATNAAELEKLRVQLEQLTVAQRDLARWLEEHDEGRAATGDAGEAFPTASWLFLGAGLAVGWTLSRVTTSRERRARGRVRL
jgi:SH3-like domain-containing protein